MRHSTPLFPVLLYLAFPILVTGCISSTAPHVHALVPLDPPPIRTDLVFIGPLPVEATYPPHTVSALQPVLRWEAFPRSKDREADREGIIGQVTEVTYDLRVWETPGSFIRERKPIYAQTGLIRPEHKIDVQLKPSTQYMWTIRARFLLNGQPRITDWGQERIWFKHLGGGGFFSRDVDHDFFGYYRFFTPSG